MPGLCCGKQRPGRFCSECGRALEGGPLEDLVRHCRVSEKSVRARAKSARQDTRWESNAEWAEKMERKADEWKARGDALVELLSRQTEDDGSGGGR